MRHKSLHTLVSQSLPKEKISEQFKDVHQTEREGRGGEGRGGEGRGGEGRGGEGREGEGRGGNADMPSLALTFPLMSTIFLMRTRNSCETWVRYSDSLSSV